MQTVNIYDQSPGVSIYYTTDGSTPTTSSTLYSGPVTVSSTETINAIATSTASGVTNSSVGTAAYTIQLPAATPTFSPAGGSYTAAQSVTIADATSGATIYYTTDGKTPTASSSVYGAPITVSSSAVLKAIAVASGFANEQRGSGEYLINSGNERNVTERPDEPDLYPGDVFSNGSSTGGALAGANPAGNSFAVDSKGNLITGDTYGKSVLEFAPGATSATVLSSSYGKRRTCDH